MREESSFNPRIVSWAGARGLSQLMPATAKRVGGWLGINASRSVLFDPETNLKIGARYFDYLSRRFNGNPVLFTAAYNAGEGNVDKWLANQGNRPSDEWVESIPFRETRGYVKRVLGTYQLYRTVHGEGDLFPDWSAHNHHTVPKD